VVEVQLRQPLLTGEGLLDSHTQAQLIAEVLRNCPDLIWS
jgi:hypothetical protein